MEFCFYLNVTMKNSFSRINYDFNTRGHQREHIYNFSRTEGFLQ